MIFAKDESTLTQAVNAERSNLPPRLGAKGSNLYAAVAGQKKSTLVFHDGISQPVIESSPPPSHHLESQQSEGEYAPDNVIKAGRICLGLQERVRRTGRSFESFGQC